MGNCLKSPTSNDILAESQYGSGPRMQLLLPHQGQDPLVQVPGEQQMRITERIRLLQYLMTGVIHQGRDRSEETVQECIICLMDFVEGDARALPCMHLYHPDCIDEWLMRSLTCPYCREPVGGVESSSCEIN